MGTSQSRPLDLIHERFLKTLAAGDTECALDLMAMAGLAAEHTLAQTERKQLLQLVRLGILRAEGADLRRDLDFEAISLRFAVESAVPLVRSILPTVGASAARRRGWIDAWWTLSSFRPRDAPDSIGRLYSALDRYVDGDRVDQEDEPDFGALAKDVEQEFAGGVTQSLDPVVPHTQALIDNFADPFLIQEFETFIEGHEVEQSLNLLAVAVPYVDYVGTDGDDQTVPELLTQSAGLLLSDWDDLTEVEEILFRLWVTAYKELAEQFGDMNLIDLDLPEFETDFPPLSEAQQRIWEWAIEDYMAQKLAETSPTESDDDADAVAPEDEAVTVDAEDIDASSEALVPRSPLIATALSHLNRNCGESKAFPGLAVAAVDAGQQAWASHSTITDSWKGDGAAQRGYGGSVQTTISRWARTAAAEMYPTPADNRPTPIKRQRRIYESFWVWTITAGVLAAMIGVQQGFWLAIGFGAFVGYMMSSNYDSISAPSLTPLPDPQADQRTTLEKVLTEIAVHVALKYDSAAYSSELSPQALREMVDGAWQPQGAPPPRMSSCTHREAEYLAAQWMRYLGATSCKVSRATRDGGVDISSDTHVAEVKHHQSPVGVGFIRQIYGAATAASKRATFFSLSGYTRDAEEFANANHILLFRYHPEQRTLTPQSRSAVVASQRGLQAERDCLNNGV